LLVHIHQSLNRPVNLLLEEDRVVASIPPPQFRLVVITQVRGSQEPLAGTHGFIIDLTDFGSHPDLVDELWAGNNSRGGTENGRAGALKKEYPRRGSGVAGPRFLDQKLKFIDQKPGFVLRKNIFALRKSTFPQRKNTFPQRKNTFP
jgi:hypothetical protein